MIERAVNYDERVGYPRFPNPCDCPDCSPWFMVWDWLKKNDAPLPVLESFVQVEGRRWDY